MNRQELVEAMAAKAGISKAAADAAVKAFIEAVTAELKAGKKVQLIGFGTFEVAKRAARKGRNPLTKKEITIKASNAPKFKAFKHKNFSFKVLHLFYKSYVHNIHQLIYFKRIPPVLSVKGISPCRILQ